MAELHRDALSAWEWLVKKGGIEPEGRDLPLVATLRVRLDPEASSLPEVLSFDARKSQSSHSFTFALCSPSSAINLG